MLLSGDDSLGPWLRAHVSAEAIEEIEKERRALETALAQPVGYVVDRARLAAARRLARQVSRSGNAQRGGLQRRLEAWTIHPLGGLAVLAAVLFAMYQFVGVFGAGTLVDLLENRLFGGWLVPWVSRGVEALFGQGFVFDLLVGDYGVVSMALTYALALILPIVTTFFLAFGFLEDSGYLPRLAVMLDRLFRVMGLNGKAVLPMVLGLGCDTMATLTARILETRKERLLVILLLALGVPCSAQMTVVLAMLAGLSWTAAALWVGVVVGVLFLVGFAASRVIPGKGSDFVLELPPLRLPSLGNIAVKTLGRLEWYLREAVPLFILGTLVLFAADRLALIGSLQRAFSPVVQGLLGLPAEATEAFLIGFLRRDFGAAGLYELARMGAMDTVGVVVAVTTITLFMPCIANLFMIIKEQGWRVALAVSAFVLPFALAVGGLLNLVLRAAGASFGAGP
jgi:ferrous iron transport protein B